MEDLIGYDRMLERSMHGIIHQVLKRIENNNKLLGNHHLIISFLTQYEGVIIPNFLKDQFSEEITIIIQYQFKDLSVEENFFSIFLSFSNKYHKLLIPYKSITSFSDPYVNFTFEFSHNKSLKKQDKKNLSEEGHIDKGNIIMIDEFRKNNNNNSE